MARPGNKIIYAKMVGMSQPFFFFSSLKKLYIFISFISQDFNHFNQVLVGDMGTGKTSLVLRFVKGQFFDNQVELLIHNMI